MYRSDVLVDDAVEVSRGELLCSRVSETAWQLRVTSRDNGHILGLVYIAASFMWQRGFCYLLG